MNWLTSRNHKQIFSRKSLPVMLKFLLGTFHQVFGSRNYVLKKTINHIHRTYQ